MSLILPNQNYVKITQCSDTTVEYDTYRDVAHRDEVKNGTVDPFTTAVHGTVAVTVDFSVPADATKSIEANRLTAAYESIKKLDRFTGAVNA